MKNLLKSSFILLAVASMTFLASCGDEDVEEPSAAPTATATFYINGEQAASPASAEIGDVVSADFGIESEGNFNVLRVFLAAGLDEIYSIELPRTNITGVADFTSFTITGLELFTIADSLESSNLSVYYEVIDDEDQMFTSTTNFGIEVESAVNAYETVLIGGFNSETLGSSYDADADSVYFASNLRGNAENQAKIEFVYYFANTPQRTIAAPNSSSAQTTWEAQNTSTWPFDLTENATVFQVADESFDFDAANSSSDLAAAYSEVSTDLDRVTNLEVGSVVIFKTVGDKIGAFEVTNVDGNSSGSITLSVKIQK